MEGFEYRDLGRQDLKGFATPMTVYQVGPRDVTRLEARGAVQTAFIGRHEEMAIFTDRWARARAAQGQVVELAGPAGIGKSRIVTEAAEQLSPAAGPAPPPVIFQCSPYHANTPLYPVVRYVLRRAGINADDTSERRRQEARAICNRQPALPAKPP